MVQFLLTAVELDEAGALTDRYASLLVEWPVIPRVGETVWLNGEAYDVESISHEMDLKPPQISVQFNCVEDDMNIFLSNGWTSRTEPIDDKKIVWRDL